VTIKAMTTPAFAGAGFARVGPLVAAVAEAALIVFVLRGRGLEVRARQIVEQDVEADAEQVLPALGQMME